MSPTVEVSLASAFARSVSIDSAAHDAFHALRRGEVDRAARLAGADTNATWPFVRFRLFVPLDDDYFDPEFEREPRDFAGMSLEKTNDGRGEQGAWVFERDRFTMWGLARACAHFCNALTPSCRYDVRFQRAHTGEFVSVVARRIL